MSQLNPLRSLVRHFRNISLSQRLLYVVLPPLLFGLFIQSEVGRLLVRDSELNLTISEQAQATQLVAEQITVFMRSLPQTVVPLTNSTALQTVINLAAQVDDVPDLAAPLPENSEFVSVRDQAMSDLTGEIYQTIIRNEAIRSIVLVGVNGAEVIRIERGQSDDLVRIAFTGELGSIADTEQFETLQTLAPLEFEYSPITVDASGHALLYITTAFFYRTEQVGGMVIALNADAFLSFARPALDPVEFTNYRLLMVDSSGRYLSDTLDPGNIAEPDYAGHLFGLGPDEAATLDTHDPDLAGVITAPDQGILQNDQIITALQFQPFDQPVEGSPWTLLMVEDEQVALIAWRRYGTILLAFALGLAVVTGLILWRASLYLVRPLNDAVVVADRISSGDLGARISVNREDEAGRLGRAINSMTTQLLANLAQMEEQFTERTRDLQVAADIASIAVGMDDSNMLLRRAVNLIRDQFEFYHVQVFMVDERRKNAALVASTGDAGRVMLDLKWSLPVGSGSVIGQVTASGQTVIALDTEDAVVVHRPNPHLPDTRSEMALPMRYGDTVIGALDIQSMSPNAFTDEDVRIFEVLANQLAIAVSNARQLEETNRQMTRVQDLNRRLTRQAWDEFLTNESALAPFISAGDEDTSAPGSIQTPIAVMGEVIGTLQTMPEDDTPLTEDEIALVQAVAERVSLAMENARLVTQTQYSLQETERLYQSAQVINSEASVEDILRTLYEYFGIPGRVISVNLFSREVDADGVPQRIKLLTIGRNNEAVLYVDDETFAGGPELFARMREVLVYNDTFSIEHNLPAEAVRYLAAEGTQAMLSIPMFAGGVVLGRLMLRHTEPYTFSERETEIMESLAGQLATVIYNRQLFEVVETERQTLKSVLDTMPTAVMVLDANTQQATLSNDQAYSLLGQDANLLELVAEQRLYRADTDEVFSLEDIPAFRALRSGKTSYSEDMAIRLPDGNVIDVMSNAAPIFDAAGNVSAVVTVFQDITELRELQNALQETLRETTALYESSRAIYASEGLEAIAGTALMHLGINAAPDEALVLLDEAPLVPDSALRVLAAEPGPLPETLSFPRQLFRADRAVRIHDVAESDALTLEEREQLLAAHTASLATVPMKVAGETVGWLALVYHTPIKIASEQWRYVESLADQSAVALQNARLRQQTEESLQETSLLYETSSLLVDVNNVQGVLDAIVKHAAGPDLSLAQVYLLQAGRTWADTDATALVAASWSDGSAPDLTGMYFSAEQYPNWQELQTDFILAIDNIAESVRLDEDSQMGYLALGLQSVTIVPLYIGDRPAGAIQFGYSSPHTHSERELRIFQNLAELATIALQNINLLEQTQHRARQLQTSAEVSQAVTSILDVQELLPRIVNLILDSFDYDHVQVFLLDDAGENAVLQASTGEVGETMLKLKWSLPVGSESVIGQVTASAMPVVALDTADAAVVHRPNPYLPDTRSEMAIPLRSRGRVVGALDVQSKLPSAFTEEDVSVLTALADQIGVALDNASLFVQTQDYTLALTEQVMSLQAMLEASQRFSSLQDTDEILHAAAEEIVGLLRVDHAGILMATGSAGMGTLVADYPPAPGLEGVQMPIEGAWWRDEYEQTRQPVVVDSVSESPLLDDATRATLSGAGIKQVVIVPFITSGNTVTGSIGLDVYEGGRAFTREDLTLLQLFATQVTSAYQNAQSFTRTQRQAEEMRFLFNVTTAAAEVSELEASMQTVITQLQDAIPSAAIGVYLRGEEDDYLERIAAYIGAPEVAIAERIAISGWVTQQAMQERRPFLLPDLKALEAHHGIMATNLNSMIGTPLFAGNEVVGLITLFERDKNAFQEGNLRLLQALSGSISAVVQNIRLLEEVQAANERLRELDKIKSQFLANMSHELRTPLNSIIGFSRVMLKGIDGPLNDMQTQDLETINSSGQHLLNLINDILDQSKIEADKLSISLDWFALDSVIEVARSMSIGLLKDKPVRLNVESEADLPQVRGDEMRTRQVLLNLLSNAAKFTYEGSITVAAFTVHREDGPYIQVSVSDTGVGIPENKLGAVFKAFEQVDGSLTRSSGGTGLGLPISKSLIEMMGGELWVESTVNVGSTFSFRIPAFAKEVDQPAVVDPENDPMTAEAQTPFDQQDVPDRKIILIIDGEVGMHHLYRSNLNKVGYTVEATANVNQARDIAIVTQPDIIIMDVRIGDGQGWHVLEWLRTDESMIKVPVVVASMDPDENRARGMGVVAYLPKPFLPDEMVQLIQLVDENHLPERLLLIDDNPESTRLIVETLREQPRYLLQTATSGKQGLSMMAQRRPDLVLLDLNMPEIDGVEVLNQIRSNPRTQNIPVVIITAEDDLVVQNRDQLGDVDVYSKNPDEHGQLLTGVSTLLADNEGHNPYSNGDNAS